MIKEIHTKSFEILLSDLKELTETNCHGEALEAVAEFFGDRQLLKAFEAINTLHTTLGYLDDPLLKLRQNISAVLWDRIEYHHGENVKTLVYNCL
jgi:hypothetical protein